MSAVDQHAEAHRLRGELRYGARRIARELGITRYAAEQLLARPLPRLVADARRPVAEPVDRPVAEVADAVAEPPRLRVDLSRRPRLLNDLRDLLDAGMYAPVAVDAAVGALAAAYRLAVARGEVAHGDQVVVTARVRRAA